MACSFLVLCFFRLKQYSALSSNFSRLKYSYYGHYHHRKKGACGFRFPSPACLNPRRNLNSLEEVQELTMLRFLWRLAIIN